MKKLICLLKGHKWSIKRYYHCYAIKHCIRCNKCKTMHDAPK